MFQIIQRYVHNRAVDNFEGRMAVGQFLVMCDETLCGGRTIRAMVLRSGLEHWNYCPHAFRSADASSELWAEVTTKAREYQEQDRRDMEIDHVE